MTKSNSYSILDNDTIELFNRDSIYQDHHNWLTFIQDKQLEYQVRVKKYGRAQTLALYAMVVFSFFFFVFALWNFSNYIDSSADDEVYYKTSSTVDAGFCTATPPSSRIDCNPDPPINAGVCHARRCCWNEQGYQEAIANGFKPESKSLPPLGVPFCYYGTNYTAYNVVSHNGKTVELKRNIPSGFDDVTRLSVTVDRLSKTMMRVKYVDSNKKRYEVPLPKLNMPELDLDESQSSFSTVYNETTQTLNIFANGSVQPLFSTSTASLVYSEQFIQISSKLPSHYLYGIGKVFERCNKNNE